MWNSIYFDWLKIQEKSYINRKQKLSLALFGKGIQVYEKYFQLRVCDDSTWQTIGRSCFLIFLLIATKTSMIFYMN